MPKRIGNYTLSLDSAPYIAGYGSCVGEKEASGPLGEEFDRVFYDAYLGQKSWERAESELLRQTVDVALTKSTINATDINYVFSGDLLDQCIGSTFGLKTFNLPHIGVYGACSTMALSLGLASCFVDSGLANNCIAATSSHFCTAEKQFRFPIEYGGQRTPTAQWTVTGAGAVVVSNTQKGIGKVRVKAVTFGKIVDKGIKDSNNMGAAMAPAAAETITNYFNDTKTVPNDYDLILTGDLGAVGSSLLYELLAGDGFDISNNHSDCGLLIFDTKTQDVHAGGSGCGCSAAVLCSRIMHHFEDGTFKNILFCATGALMSPTSQKQGEPTPGIAHLINLSI